MSRMLKVKDVAAKLTVKSSVVLGWIAKGHLPALDVRRVGGKRPAWRIEDQEVSKFLRQRSSETISPSTRRGRQNLVTQPNGIINFH